MNPCIRTAVALGAVAVLALCASPAPAAKGVKKTGQHQVSGTIVSVNHARKGHGTITIQVRNQKFKKGAVAGQARRRQFGQMQTFTISQATRVHAAGNVRRGLTSLRTGEHVTIAAHQRHADRITVQHRNRNRVVRR